MLNPVQESIILQSFDVSKTRKENVTLLLKACANNQMIDEQQQIFTEEATKLVFKLNEMTIDQYKEVINELFGHVKNYTNLFDSYLDSEN